MLNQIKSILFEIKPELPSAINDDFDLSSCLDSMDIIILVDMLESNFDITIEGLKIIPENFSSPLAIMSLVKSHFK